MAVRQPGNRKKHSPSALPVFSTDTVEEARGLIVRTCRLLWDNETYVYSRPWREGTLEGLWEVSADLDRIYGKGPASDSI